MTSREHILGYKLFKGPEGPRGEGRKSLKRCLSEDTDIDRKRKSITKPITYKVYYIALGKEKSPYFCLGNSNRMFLKTASNEGNFWTGARS